MSQILCQLCCSYKRVNNQYDGYCISEYLLKLSSIQTKLSQLESDGLGEFTLAGTQSDSIPKRESNDKSYVLEYQRVSTQLRFQWVVH